LRGRVENLKIEQPKIKSNESLALKNSNHGSRAAEKEEEIIDSEDQDEAKIQEGQSSRQSYHRSELVFTPNIWSCLSVTLCLLPDEVLTLCLPGTKAKPLPKTTAD
jgi:hypothetical protein